MTSTRTVCTAPNCGLPEHSKKLCGTHYHQMRKRGWIGPIRRVRPKGARELRDELGRKQCATCHSWMETVHYGSNARFGDGLSDMCLPCLRARPKRHRAESYGMSEAEYDAMFAAQGERCAICRRATPGPRGWTIDHDHACCKVAPTCGGCTRGILCQRCNNGLGQIGDTEESLLVALEYVRAAQLRMVK